MASDPNSREPDRDPAHTIPKSPGLRALYNRYIGDDPGRVAEFERVMAEERAEYAATDSTINNRPKPHVVPPVKHAESLRGLAAFHREQPSSVRAIMDAADQLDRLREVVLAFGIEADAIDAITPAEAAQVREQWQDDWDRAGRDSADLDNLRRGSTVRIERLTAENAELVAMLKILIICVGGEYGQFAPQARAANQLIGKATMSTGDRP